MPLPTYLFRQEAARAQAVAASAAIKTALAPAPAAAARPTAFTPAPAPAAKPIAVVRPTTAPAPAPAPVRPTAATPASGASRGAGTAVAAGASAQGGACGSMGGGVAGSGGGNGKRPEDSGEAACRLQLEKLRTQYRQGASWVRPEEIKNPELYKIVNKLYRERASVGSGSTADAVRVEMTNKGAKIGERAHSQKAEESITALTKLLESEVLTPHERMIAENIKLDLLDSLGKKLWYSQTSTPTY